MLTFLPGAIFTRDAFNDVKGILDDLVEQSNGRDQSFRRVFTETILTLVDFPKMGSPRDFDGVSIRELRTFPVKDFKMYLIYYQPFASADGIEVVRVLHHARNASALLANDSDDSDADNSI